MSEFRFRTEDILPEELNELFVSTNEDRKTIDLLKAPTPIILEGSRGTGKSFLMKMAEMELENSFEKDRVLPVYLTFNKSSLIYTSDNNQFLHWMISRLCSQILRSLKKHGLILPSTPAISLLNGEQINNEDVDRQDLLMEEIAKKYENSWRNPNQNIDSSSVPDIDDFRESIDEICRSKSIRRICILFDEAVHVFRPEQQRQFFTMFRDLRSPRITCNAAVYPGVTSYGSTFELTHDATLRKVERDFTHQNYLNVMKEIVIKQADSSLIDSIHRNGNNFRILAYSVSGNPRYLLKILDKCPKMTSRDVNDAIKSFYRTDIWTEYSSLSDKYIGHRTIVDWGRDFIEKTVIPETKKKNDNRLIESKNELTCYFWIHRDAPAVIKEALRLLAYNGIIQKHDEAVRATRSELGTRYSLNLGCVLSIESNPISSGEDIVRSLSIKRFTEFGANHPEFQSLSNKIPLFESNDTINILQAQLNKDINNLDLTVWQKQKLREVELMTIGSILKTEEEDIIKKIRGVGQKKARRIKNTATTAVLEYLSG